ncbi:DUF3482 domain-containing protein [Marinospirillum perlucidum]|uniref:DUF3482 domain-containing protein n=1 Tax=Marinospirillum perlucidum TaxID=1982602 RepID=UPI000DF16790|nr:DUF3482 domain-containing protein [Marinospirillum perlucidum]
MTPPHFCVVGHPNQGKSSLVSTLVENDSVKIGTESGTTQSSQDYEFHLGNQCLLTLTDTPGFQRPRQLLAWLEAESVSPAERPQRVRDFLKKEEHWQSFPDECQLLRPIMQGAGILYVTDAASEPTAADEAEMEILRWTGQPRMAVINPITQEGPHQQWQATLNQFFQWVRIFNPLTASLPARQALLRALAELTSEWTPALHRLSQLLASRDQQRLEEVSLELAEYWCEQISRREALGGLPPLLAGSPEEFLQEKLDAAENQLFEHLSQKWGHASTRLETTREWELGQENLMNTENWYLWGLKQRDLLITAGAAGMAAGSLIDLGVGGSSFMLGALSGGLLGSTSGWWASKQLPGKRLGWLPLAGKKDYVGPVRHPNFPLVVMARALTFTRLLWLRPHAQRTRLTLQAQASDWPRSQQVQLLQWAKLLQDNKWKSRHQEALTTWISQHLREKLKAAMQEEVETSWR